MPDWLLIVGACLVMLFFAWPYEMTGDGTFPPRWMRRLRRRR